MFKGNRATSSVPLLGTSSAGFAEGALLLRSSGTPLSTRLTTALSTRLRNVVPALIVLGVLAACPTGGVAAEGPPTVQDQAQLEQEMLRLLDAPLLFTKRHSYSGIHIYDTYYKWSPGGGGIYVLENPAL